MSSCILYQNSLATTTLLDIPRSIEFAQGCTPDSQRLISLKPLEYPYPSVEPKSTRARANTQQVSLQDLLLQKHLQFALDEVKGEYHDGPWCLPRVSLEADSGILPPIRKRRRLDTQEDLAVMHTPVTDGDIVAQHVHLPHPLVHFQNSDKEAYGSLDTENLRVRLPPKCTLLQGDIAATLPIFKSLAPKFDIILLDPPWPNRSARRKQSYGISYGASEIRSLLSSIPVYDHLSEDGIVAVWVTNKTAFREMILGEGGLFEAWDVRLEEEWIWLKVTSGGEPICALDSTWRKPFEVLLVGRRGGALGDMKRRVIVGVPDLHSRKPNLKILFERLLLKKEGGYEALEIFARNLTSKWWSWGNEVLKFQTLGHWTTQS